MQLPFRRKQSTTDEVPTEIKQYYTSEQRDRAGATWLVGAAVFLITVLLVLGLFYGGRALYRAITDDANQTTEQTTSDANTANDNQTKSGDEEVTSPPSSNDTPEPDSAPSDEGGQEPQDTPEDTPSRTPNTGPSQPELPQTGPSLDL